MWLSNLFKKSLTTSASRRRTARGKPRLCVEALEDRVTPATISWTGAGTNTNWANPVNWNLGRAPLAGDDLIFGTLAAPANRTTTDNLNGLPVFNSITIAASGYVINGSPSAPLLALGGSINAGSNLGSLSITKEDEGGVIQIVNLILGRAIKSRASDIHIEPYQKVLRVRYRMDGVMHEQPSPPKKFLNASLAMIIVLPGEREPEEEACRRRRRRR